MKIFTLIICIGLGWNVMGQTRAVKKEGVVYKKVDSVSLVMDFYFPPDMVSGKTYPAILFFHGGGWNGGSPVQFSDQAEYFAKKGIVSALVTYRLKNIHKTTPFEALQDAKSAVRFIKKNGALFQIDTSRVIASGGSAGGHLAAATAVINGYNSPSDDLTYSPKPSALILFNPVIDNGPAGFGYKRIGEAYKRFSPLHNLKKGAPPTLILLGEKDHIIPVETINYYKLSMEAVGSRCDVVLYENKGHGFFNKGEEKKKSILDAERFLISLGYIE